jgi:hypothetical protein
MLLDIKIKVEPLPVPETVKIQYFPKGEFIEVSITELTTENIESILRQYRTDFYQAANKRIPGVPRLRDPK